MRNSIQFNSTHAKGLRMDFINDQEDRISNLPYDIIHHIFSFLDMKYAVQTSALSRKWRYIWVSMPHLNINSDSFRRMRKFSKFMEQAVIHHSNQTEVCAVELRFRGETTELSVTDFVKYAYRRNVRQLTMEWVTRKCHDLPPCIFSSPALKHLTLNGSFKTSCIRNSVWNFPALETLSLTKIRFGNGLDLSLDLFNQCVNLKDIILHDCSMYGVDTFSICAPHLVNLTITKTAVFPEVFNVVAPQLETLTADGFSSDFQFLKLSTVESFNSLKKVNLSLLNKEYEKESHVPRLLDLFKIVSSVKFLILDVNIIESLSSSPGQLSHEPCPFNDLKCLEINTLMLKEKDCIPTIPVQVRNYLLGNSPNATFIMGLPPKMAASSSVARSGTNRVKPSRRSHKKILTMTS